MSDIVLKVSELSKMYRLGEIGTGTLSHDLNRWWHRVRGKEDPYLRIGEVNRRDEKGKSSFVWALKDINFEVRRGEVLGIIGKNGAGKSTLLKVLSKVTGPTHGSIRAKGRIASLLEVGTGFHSELTGRENIYLNGTILGMSRAEVARKLDEIVDFAGVARYLDTPVKRYSSGMKVRLGFAVAAHLEPEILIIDEVLAVGDIEFQRKAIGKMQNVSNEQGRTVLFVSHNMKSVKQLCTRGIMLENGTVAFEGNTQATIDRYLDSRISGIARVLINDNSVTLRLEEIFLADAKSEIRNNFFMDETIHIHIKYRVFEPLKGVHLSIAVKDADSNILFRSWDIDEFPERSNKTDTGCFLASIPIPANLLNTGKYTVYIASAHTKQATIKLVDDVISFEVFSRDEDIYAKSYMFGGAILLPLKWSIQKIN